MKKIVRVGLIMLLPFALLPSVASAKKLEIPRLPPVVITTQAKQIDWQPSLQAIGTLTAYNGTMISAEASGRVTKLYFKSGQSIEKGQPIIEIFPDMVQATLTQNQANLKLNKLTYEREKKLAERNFAAQSTLDEAKADVDVSQAKVASSQAQLKQYILKAPFSGKLGLRLVSLGQYLTIGEPIVNLQSIDPLRVDFSVPGNYLGMIKVGEKITVTSRAYPGEKFIGEIYATDSSIDSSTRMLGVRASIPNHSNKLLPGAFVNVTLDLEQPEPAVVIPTTAILYARQGSYVYLLNDKQVAKQQFITPGEELDHNRTIVMRGLAPGDTIIAQGQIKVKPGDKVLTQAQADTMMNKKSKKR